MNKAFLLTKKSKLFLKQKKLSTSLDSEAVSSDAKKTKAGDNVDPVNESDLKNESFFIDNHEELKQVKNLVEFSYSLQAFISIANPAAYPVFETKNIHSQEFPIERKLSNIFNESLSPKNNEIENANKDLSNKKDNGKAKLTAVPIKSGLNIRIINHFNLCERASQTSIITKRDIGTQTVPVLKLNFFGSVSQWLIYDQYRDDFDSQQKNKDKQLQLRKKQANNLTTEDLVAGKIQFLNEFDKWKILERMINQNLYVEIMFDFKYWEDPSDQYKKDEGTLLPLWKFNCEETKKMPVTYLIWFDNYTDLVVACYGSLNLLSATTSGYFCLYSLKNPSFPETIIKVSCGVMCADIHSKRSNYIAIGLFNGDVMVFNMDLSDSEPQYTSKFAIEKHTNIIWEIKWGSGSKNDEMIFYTVSADGKIKSWMLMQTELVSITLTELLIDKEPIIGVNHTQYYRKHSITCLSFQPENKTTYLVGTEEGLIFKCNTEFSSLVLQTYQAHNLPVYRIDYNQFKSNIFISCSADWKIKIWEDNRLEALFTFDLCGSVGDVKWSPYSSTVFAATTNQGKVYVYDLNANKFAPLCAQSMVSSKKNSLTRLAFNKKHPILIVGDEKGNIITLKLSPNLRQMCKPQKKEHNFDQRTLQIQKLEKLLINVREPLNI